MGNRRIGWRFCLLVLMLISSCGDEGKCGKACGWDFGFERGNGPSKVCFCQTSDGKIYGPVPMGEEEPNAEADSPETTESP